MINGTRFLGALPTPNGRQISSFGEAIKRDLVAQVAQKQQRIAGELSTAVAQGTAAAETAPPQQPVRVLNNDFFRTLAQLLEPKNAKSQNASYIKITTPDELAPDIVKAKVNQIRNLYEANPEDGIKSFFGYIHDRIAQTCTEFWNTFFLKDVHPTAAELKELGIQPQFKARAERMSAKINDYITPLNPKAQSKLSFLNGTMLDKNGNPVGEERILAQALVDSNGLIKEMYNAISPTGEAVALKYKDAQNASVRFYDSANKASYSMELADGALTITDHQRTLPKPLNSIYEPKESGRKARKAARKAT